VRAVKGRPFRQICRGARAAPTASSTATTIRSKRPGFDAKVKLLETIDAYARAKDQRVKQVTASLGASWQVVEILRP
jgi:predicted Zn-dependent protease